MSRRKAEGLLRKFPASLRDMDCWPFTLHVDQATPIKAERRDVVASGLAPRWAAQQPQESQRGFPDVSRRGVSGPLRAPARGKPARHKKLAPTVLNVFRPGICGTSRGFFPTPDLPPLRHTVASSHYETHGWRLCRYTPHRSCPPLSRLSHTSANPR